MERTSTPEHYIQMLNNFREGVDTVADPENAFIDGTPEWMIREWVEFNSTTAGVC